MVIATFPTFGYSQKSLPDKLGYKPELSIVFVALPHSLEELPDTVDFAKVARRQDWSRPLGPNRFDMIHAFSMSRAEIVAGLDGPASATPETKRPANASRDHEQGVSARMRSSPKT